MRGYEHTTSAMGTVVSIRAFLQSSTDTSDEVSESSHRDAFDALVAAVHRAAAWFEQVEQCCSRFDPTSELRRLCMEAERDVPVSAMLFETVHFALAVAEASDGAFDPTIGTTMEQLGFVSHWRSAVAAPSDVAADRNVSWRDVHLDTLHSTIRLHRPLLLDLGAIAKGLAVDLAARELASYKNFAIDAGGDLYLGGRNATDEPWTVGIRHPRATDSLLMQLLVSDCAVCTSGDYERRAADTGAHHLLEPRSRQSASGVASVTVVAQRAMSADALATAAFVLGADRGIALLEQSGVNGIIVREDLRTLQTPGMAQYLVAPADRTPRVPAIAAPRVPTHHASSNAC
jgi:thiamine biosynthesis lipoprotein